MLDNLSIENPGQKNSEKTQISVLSSQKDSLNKSPKNLVEKIKKFSEDSYHRKVQRSPAGIDKNVK